MTTDDGFASADVARAWPYIQRSVERIVEPTFDPLAASAIEQRGVS